MFSKLRTLTVVCGVAVLAISAGALACEKHQQIAAKAQCGTQKTAVVQVADGTQKQCSKSRRASTVAVASTKAGCAKSAQTPDPSLAQPAPRLKLPSYAELPAVVAVPASSAYVVNLSNTSTISIESIAVIIESCSAPAISSCITAQHPADLC